MIGVARVHVARIEVEVAPLPRRVSTGRPIVAIEPCISQAARAIHAHTLQSGEMATQMNQRQDDARGHRTVKEFFIITDDNTLITASLQVRAPFVTFYIVGGPLNLPLIPYDKPQSVIFSSPVKTERKRVIRGGAIISDILLFKF